MKSKRKGTTASRIFLGLVKWHYVIQRTWSTLLNHSRWEEAIEGKQSLRWLGHVMKSWYPTEMISLFTSKIEVIFCNIFTFLKKWTCSCECKNQSPSTEIYAERSWLITTIEPNFHTRRCHMQTSLILPFNCIQFLCWFTSGSSIFETAVQLVFSFKCCGLVKLMVTHFPSFTNCWFHF